MAPYSKIFLVGFMGSGKTTVGKKLASRLGWSFMDLDERIESGAGMKITEIFSEKGEPYFRKLEYDVLRNIEESETVVSTGGGTPCSDDNMEYMLNSGLTIYLKMTPSQLKGRLLKSSRERPLIKNVGIRELEGFIEKKLLEREKWYCRAELTFERSCSDLSDLEELVRKRIM